MKHLITGKVYVAFPAGFNGIVTAKTSNAKIYLSEGLKPNSMIIPSGPGSSGTTIYRIKPHAPHVSGSDDKSLDEEGMELDKCNIQTSNSSINLGYLDEVNKVDSDASGKKKESSSCLIS